MVRVQICLTAEEWAECCQLVSAPHPRVMQMHKVVQDLLRLIEIAEEHQAQVKTLENCIEVTFELSVRQFISSSESELSEAASES